MKKNEIKVLLGPSSYGALDDAPLIKLKAAGLTLIDNPYKRKLTKQELFKLLPGVKGLIAGLEPLDREVLTKSELKVISRCGAGLSNVDLEAAKELGIKVEYTPTGPTTAVAELTVGCLLSLLRQVSQMNSSLHDGKWDKRIGRQLSGLTVAVIGYGNIGGRVGKLLSALGAKILIVDPRLKEALSLKEALKQADVITLHCSGEECLLGEPEFALMKQGVFLLNAARGSLVDEQALLNSLNSGQVAGAWFDTFSVEPYHGELCKYQQVLLTPHVGSYTLEGRRSMELETADNLIKHFKRGKIK